MRFTGPRFKHVEASSECLKTLYSKFRCGESAVIAAVHSAHAYAAHGRQGFYEVKPGRSHSQRIPSVRLRGLWLEQLGFAVGCKLQITAREGELVVTVIER